MKDKVKTCLFPELLHNGVLAVLQDRGLELHVARLVNTVDIAECRSKEIPCALDGIQLSGNLKGVIGRRIEIGSRLTLHAVLLSADNSGFDLEDKIISLEPFQELYRNIEVLLKRQGASIEHMAVEEVRPARRPPPFGLLHERNDQLTELVSLAVVCMKGDIDRIPFRRAMHMFGDRDRPKSHIP